MTDEILRVENLKVSFQTEGGRVGVINDVSFGLKKGETLGIVGESGSGKSVTSLSIMRLLPYPAGHIDAGKILLDGDDIRLKPITDMYKIRGNRISMIFQEPMTSLNPVHKIGKQLAECFELHFPEMKADEIRKESIDILAKVGIPLPEKRLNEFPHQLSGGLRQRVMIAMALSCKPDILIADEPTTALDVTIQAQILKLMKDLQEEMNMSIIFITHDLGVIAEICDRVVVMYSGQVVETADVYELFEKPSHPYTQGLLNSIPRMEQKSKTHLDTIEGMVPDFSNLPPGCRFQNRCPHAKDSCSNPKTLDQVSAGHLARCDQRVGVK